MVFDWAKEILAMKRDMELVQSTSFSVASSANYDSINKEQEFGSQLSLLLQESIQNQSVYPAKPKKMAALRKDMIKTCSFVVGVLLVLGVGTLYSTSPQFQSMMNFNKPKIVVDLSKHPLSTKSPMDITFPLYPERSLGSSPHVLSSYESTAASVPSGDSDIAREDLEKVGATYPTNAWYENLLLFDPNQGYTSNNQVYSMPFILDVSGPIPGLRMNLPTKLANDQVVQMYSIPDFGLTIGGIGWQEATESASDKANLHAIYGNSMTYDLSEPPSELGLVLRYGDDDKKSMRTPIIRGMPYGTMIYKSGIQPSIFSTSVLKADPVIDGKTVNMNCTDSSLARKGDVTLFPVEKEVQLHFAKSDFTWMVFYSRPVNVYCLQNTETNEFQLIAEDSPSDAKNDLVVRLALLDSCSSGEGYPYFCANNPHKSKVTNAKRELLRQHADVYPYSPSVHFLVERSDFEVEPSALIEFNWDATSMSTMEKVSGDGSNKGILMFALGHQIEEMTKQNSTVLMHETNHCEETLHGTTCLSVPVNNSDNTVWSMYQDLSFVNNLGNNKFTAPRPPHYSLFPALAESLSTDIHYKIPDNYVIGAGDTYFSGKMLAKLGRILVISRELKALCSGKTHGMYSENNIDHGNIRKSCRKIEEKLPSDEDVQAAIDELKKGVEIWLNGKAEAPFAYDGQWGGLVNCGCAWDWGHCDNVFPDCPALNDPGANFGQGFYNDHHFHQGYHVYAAAILASFDPAWGRDYFENVIALIRDFANPSTEDPFFTTFRHKDWYLGSSWASGIATLGGNPYANGRNQESSSEAIAAYEAIGMYGSIMTDVWKDFDSKSSTRIENIERSLNIRDVGRILTVTEVNAASRYWHVTRSKNGHNDIYPDNYGQAAVGMLWNTMAQFQTWFGNIPFEVYGIQLLPITPISEAVYDVDWVQEFYPSLAKSCEADDRCAEQGWSILQYTSESVLGQRQKALENSLKLTDRSFTSAGGNGQSMTNTIWFIATRPDPVFTPPTDDAINIQKDDDDDNEDDVNGSSSDDAMNVDDDADLGDCKPCTKKQCAIAQCPQTAPFTCAGGPALGGCSGAPWTLSAVACTSCCDITHCDRFN